MLKKSLFWQIFRLVFVIFSLYLLGDAFYRWDGFRYYASFSEFLPSLALVSLLWSLVALIASFPLWLFIRIGSLMFKSIGWQVTTHTLLMFTVIYCVLIALFWMGKQIIFPFYATLGIKLIILLLMGVLSVFLTLTLRNRSEQWINIAEEKFTPLVWLFSVWLVISVFLVTYYTWIKKAGSLHSEKIIFSAVKDRNWPNIILVTFDALTTRDMSLYGWYRETTPFIREWAKQASVFTRLKASGNATDMTTVSLMTGKRVWSHGAFHIEGGRVINTRENLARILRENGYYTMAYIVNPIASVRKLDIADSFNIAPTTTGLRVRGKSLFDIIDIVLNQLFEGKIQLYNWILKEDFVFYRFLVVVTPKITKTLVAPEVAFNNFLNTLGNNPPEPYFAWIHLLPPHDPYLPPEPFIGMFNKSPKLRTKESQEELIRSRLGKVKYDLTHEVEILRARYDEFIRYCDEQFKTFIEELIERGKLSNTIIILSSDHGESFEHNYFIHAGTHLYEQVTSIPLIIKEPGQTEGRTIDDLVEQIDIPVTILEFVGIEKPSWMEGRSLYPLLRGKRLSPTPVFSMAFPENPGHGAKITKGTIAVWDGDYKLIHYLEENKSLLFNLREDPDELNNILDVGKRLLKLIKDNLKEANERITENRNN